MHSCTGSTDDSHFNTGTLKLESDRLGHGPHLAQAKRTDQCAGKLLAKLRNPKHQACGREQRCKWKPGSCLAWRHSHLRPGR